MHFHLNRAAILIIGASSLAVASPVRRQNNGTGSYEIKWKPCSNTTDIPNLDCGTLEVPMDWNNTGGSKIKLDVARLRTNGTNNLGSIFFNPGGPGGPARDTCAGLSQDPGDFSELLDHYDLICPDPRGVGPSTQVVCDDDLWASTPSYFVDDEASWEKVLEFNKALGESCLNLTGPHMGFLDTASAAKDLDALRIAVGDDKFNYLGFSYGTQLGARYAELFPDHIGRMVLDGGVDPSLSEYESYVQGNWAMNDELVRFFEWCDYNSSCALHNSNSSDSTGNSSTAAIWDTLIARANETPIPAPGCAANATGGLAGTCKVNATGYDIIFKLENIFQRYANWPALSQAMKQATEGNATLLSVDFDPLAYANLAIGCLDNPTESTTYDEHVTLQNLGKAMFPHALGSSMQLQFATTCIGWPFKPRNPPHMFNSTAGDGLSPILIVNADHDPATGISEAVGLHRQIPNSIFLSRTGDGHTSYGADETLRDAMNAWLINGTMPAQNTVVVEDLDWVPT
ncbi:uncharacterized protein PV06_00568 [Exophiala oligosperma]|uniref:AB hydrolase-1 domain-containing protein n=1 Tax=Exophiala oligosperma TaxID=215243 RepID=A0A0D2EJ14_9EURO|nr:uncharacterized protein PV06_00568 [Exophiala oligosperma]KIW47919.1 hypothetical protein PV06_00568 [Exophiala oligosperma]